MSARRIPDGSGRISVDLTPDGPMLTVDTGSEVVEFSIPDNGTAVELAACLFFVAMLQSGEKDAEKITERFGALLNQKAADYARAIKQSRN